jgi:hypothetical protein
MHEIEIRLEGSVEDGHDVITREGKHAPATEVCERLSYDICASQGLGHRPSFPRLPGQLALFRTSHNGVEREKLL